MAINGVTYGTSSVLNQSVLSLKNQMTQLQSQLTTGEKSTTYAGMGVNETFAIAARSQMANISAFTDTMTNINTNIGVANTALQALVNIGTTVQNSAGSSNQTLNSNGQTMGQQTAAAQLGSMLGILNTQAGDRYLFSGSAINTPSVASYDQIMNGTTTQAGLKQVIAERKQADLGASGLGRLVVTSPAASSPTAVQVAEDSPGSPFGFKLNAVSSTLNGTTVTATPTGSPAALTVDLGATNPSNGDKVSFQFNLPDGSTQSITLTASSATSPPAGSFAIGTTSANTATNLGTALTTAIQGLANTSLVAASAIQAGNDFFNTTSTATGGVATNQATVAGPVTGATALSGAVGSDSLSTSFAVGDTITVNGTPIKFVAANATGNQLNVTDSVQTLLSKIDSITGTTTPSTISGGVISLHTDNASSLSVTSSNTAAFAALGFPPTATAVQPPLRVSGSPPNAATALVGGTPANTISWYTGNPGPTAQARASSTSRIDQSVTVQYGIQANEQSIRTQLQNLAVYAAFTASPTGGATSTAQIETLSADVAQNLSVQPGQQSIQDIQSDLATAQATMKDAGARQTQSQALLQNLVDQAETVSTDQVASEVLALQNALQASYQTTSMISQLTLTKFLPAG